MNSDEQLDRLLDSLQPPALKEDFYRKLLQETTPVEQPIPPARGLFARLIGFPHLPAIAASAAALVLGALLILGSLKGGDGQNAEKFVTIAPDTELLWFSEDELTDDDEFDMVALTDIGVAELYAIDQGTTEQGF